MIRWASKIVPPGTAIWCDIAHLQMRDAGARTVGMMTTLGAPLWSTWCPALSEVFIDSQMPQDCIL